MKKIEIEILNPDSVEESVKTMVCAARLTQRGEKIKGLNDFKSLYEKPYSSETVANMASLPHPTIQKFGAINVAVVGASRRFLAQITRHQNEVKFMSASLQYSDYSGAADFVVPYSLTHDPDAVDIYLETCSAAMTEYEELVAAGLDNDAAGYMAPQGLRNVLIISATPYQWKHMIKQRTCRRNTAETRYVMLKIWEKLYLLNSDLFSPSTTGPFCMCGSCEEGTMTCGKPIENGLTPAQILEADFPLLMT
jgi:thymidylate synthase (FAD)